MCDQATREPRVCTCPSCAALRDRVNRDGPRPAVNEVDYVARWTSGPADGLHYDRADFASLVPPVQAGPLTEEQRRLTRSAYRRMVVGEFKAALGGSTRTELQALANLLAVVSGSMALAFAIFLFIQWLRAG